MEEHERHRAAQLRLLTQTGPETLMGRLLRTFWHPVAVSTQLAAGSARSVRILCEDLTLYRGESGTPYLIGGACAPAEQHARAERVRIPSYPVHEYRGLVFAYLGEGEAPPFDLPRKDSLEQPGVDISNHAEVWDCNWLQQVENSLDSTHLSFVHQWPKPTRLGEEIGAAIPELEYVETSAGIQQTARRPGSIRVSNWTFPNCNNVLAAPPRKGDPWINAVGWQVPIDDENTLRIAIYSYPGGDVGERLRQSGAVNVGNCLDHAAVLFNEHRVPDGIAPADRIMAQDYAAVRGQGRIHDRTKERLGASDAGIALLRRIIFRELDALREGRPTKRWTKIETPIEMQRLVAAS